MHSAVGTGTKTSALNIRNNIFFRGALNSPTMAPLAGAISDDDGDYDDDDFFRAQTMLGPI